VSHSFLSESLFPFSASALSFLTLSAVLRIGFLWEAGLKRGIFLEQNQLNRLKMAEVACFPGRNGTDKARNLCHLIHLNLLIHSLYRNRTHADGPKGKSKVSNA